MGGREKRVFGGVVTLTKEEKIARLRILRSNAVGATTFWNMIQLYGSAVESLRNIPELSKISAKKVYLKSEKEVLAELMKLKEMGARMVFLEDELYPPLLRNIPDPPPVLTFFGNHERIRQFYRKHMLAVVGSRNSSIHANKFCSKLVEDLGKKDGVIVSGLARGIDTSAHEGSLESGTVAVLAGGIDVIYPKENAKLYEKIAAKGGIFTETPYGVSPQAQLFPRRNRIIAGMSYGTVVVEAAANSGSLITAKFALEYNREVFAVPGFPLDPRSFGSNSLIKQRAILIQNAQDIIDEIDKHQLISQQNLFEERGFYETDSSNNYKSLEKQAPSSKTDAVDTTKIKKNILSLLSLTPITIEELISSIKIPPREVLMALLDLELTGKIIRIHGQKVCLTFEDNAAHSA